MVGGEDTMYTQYLLFCNCLHCFTLFYLRKSLLLGVLVSESKQVVCRTCSPVTPVLLVSRNKFLWDSGAAASQCYVTRMQIFEIYPKTGLQNIIKEKSQ